MRAGKIAWFERALALAFREAILYYGGRDNRRLRDPAVVFLRDLGQFRFTESSAGRVLLSGEEIHSTLKGLPCDRIAHAGAPLWHARKLADAHFELVLQRLENQPQQSVDLL